MVEPGVNAQPASALGDWDSGAWSSSATGDAGPWARWVPLAWTMVADSAGHHKPPPDPHGPNRFDELIAWWAPLLQLSTYAFGWAYPTRGLARWDQAGRPLADPVLAVIERWWGKRLVDVLAWGQDFVPGLAEAPNLAAANKHLVDQSVSDQVVQRGKLFQPYTFRQSDLDWVDVWERPGSNKFHSWGHASIPERGREPEALWLRGQATVKQTPYNGGGPSEAIISDSYAGWYRELLATGAGFVKGRSRRVDVVVRPLGWLGTYRCSRETGLWFRGRHQIHMLGND